MECGAGIARRVNERMGVIVHSQRLGCGARPDAAAMAAFGPFAAFKAAPLSYTPAALSPSWSAGCGPYKRLRPGAYALVVNFPRTSHEHSFRSAIERCNRRR